MDFIYRRAYLTLIVADGEDCDSGIPSIQLRSPVQATATIRGLAVGTVLLSLKAELLRSKWASRAWTLQEYALSFRSLIFTRRQIIFSCADGLCREDVCGSLVKHLPRNARYLLPIALDFSLANRLPLNVLTDVYVTLVGAFSTRRVTYADDILKAFSGISEALKSHIGDFTWGVPRNYAAFCVCWASHDDLVRREGFPSWSWAGWQIPAGNDARIDGIHHLESDYAYDIKLAEPLDTLRLSARNRGSFGRGSEWPQDYNAWAFYAPLPGPNGWRQWTSGASRVEENGTLCMASCKATLDIQKYPGIDLNLRQHKAPTPSVQNTFLSPSPTSETRRGSRISQLFSRRSSPFLKPNVHTTSTEPSNSNVDFILLAICGLEVVILPVVWKSEFTAQRIGNPQVMNEGHWFKEKVLPYKFCLR